MSGPFEVELDHVQPAMPAGEEGRARSFYCELLGMAELPKPATFAGRGGNSLDSLDSLDALAARWHRHGHDVRWADALPGRRRFYAGDPFGNRRELMERR